MNMNHESTKLSRRGFLGLGAVAAAGSIIGLSGCAAQSKESATAAPGEQGGVSDWLGAEPEITDISRTEETDFLIIGAGAAGCAAAATASDLGMNFMLCEKTSAVQETREYFGAVNTKYTKSTGEQLGVDLSIDKMKLLNELSRYASGKCDLDVIKVWLDESAEVIEWLDPLMLAAEKPCILDAPQPHATGGTDYFLPALQHVWLTPYTPPMRNDILAEHMKAAGNEIYFGYEMVKLIHEDNKVTGAIFNTADGYVQVNAKDTLLATGGYAANPVMMSALQPAALVVSTASSYAPNCTGDGIKAGIWAGGVKDIDVAPMIFDRGAVAPGVDCGYVGEGEKAVLPGTIFQANIGSQPFLKVNRNGQRFCNESTPYDFMCFNAMQQPGGVWCQVFDANAPADIIRFSTVGCSAFANQMMAMGMPIDEFCAVELEAGIMVKADTLEELAEKLELPKDEFIAQVEAYNAMFDAQIDDQYGKEAYRLSAIREAPFYGCWFGGSLLTTIDGLRINKHMQVLNESGKIIEGFYAAGDVSGSFFSGNYPEYLVGVASGRSTTEGRHVARYLAGEIS